MAFQLNLNTETLRQVITAHPICLEPHTPVRDAFRRMNEQRRGAVLVCRAGVLAGIFTERDAVTLMADGAQLDVPISAIEWLDRRTLAVGFVGGMIGIWRIVEGE